MFLKDERFQRFSDRSSPPRYSMVSFPSNRNSRPRYVPSAFRIDTFRTTPVRLLTWPVHDFEFCAYDHAGEKSCIGRCTGTAHPTR